MRLLPAIFCLLLAATAPGMAANWSIVPQPSQNGGTPNPANGGTDTTFISNAMVVDQLHHQIYTCNATVNYRSGEYLSTPSCNKVMPCSGCNVLDTADTAYFSTPTLPSVQTAFDRADVWMVNQSTGAVKVCTFVRGAAYCTGLTFH